MESGILSQSLEKVMKVIGSASSSNVVNVSPLSFPEAGYGLTMPDGFYCKLRHTPGQDYSSVRVIFTSPCCRSSWGIQMPRLQGVVAVCKKCEAKLPVQAVGWEYFWPAKEHDVGAYDLSLAEGALSGVYGERALLSPTLAHFLEATGEEPLLAILKAQVLTEALQVVVDDYVRAGAPAARPWEVML